MPYEQGDIWWGPAPHKSGPSYRPWVIVSDSSHPFSHTECIALAMTTQQHAGAIAVADADWLEGGSAKDAYISPWYTTTIKHRDFDRRQGRLVPAIISEAISELHRYTPSPDK
ncbi:type II toxin-antitoxin system PemK/MazF family toxin [Haloarcula nitratireducens]|uniref:Type II toxin-antitoxin system PemK/MazF family toxin n=1 Tax=Haloarcula nitratireducens TaxID=2487749 RepID=A0AAW4PKM4_9EURY|nr:type II toxin-antitoxin system PemK/MazF family toxin [Halomicroarcula nitratireducens]MBX0297986.1 type II toxin-antitoxin system PemK/MazF family toxin [Halomicroarcula nitratireducens]